MAKILLVDESGHKMMNDTLVNKLEGEGHQVTYSEVDTREDAAAALPLARQADVVVLKNIGKLAEFSLLPNRDIPDAIQFTRDMAAQGKPVIVYDNLTVDLLLKLHGEGVTAIDASRFPVPLRTLTMAIADTVGHRPASRQPGGGGR